MTDDTLYDQLEAALNAPADEKNTHIQAALHHLEHTDAGPKPQTSAPASATTPDRPPECVRWTSEDWGVLEIEVSRPLVEWMELEADERSTDSIAQWARGQLRMNLGYDLQKEHGFSADGDVELPEAFARRAQLYHADMCLHGGESSLRDLIFNHMDVDATFLLDGEPVAADEECDRANGGYAD